MLFFSVMGSAVSFHSSTKNYYQAANNIYNIKSPKSTTVLKVDLSCYI